MIDYLIFWFGGDSDMMDHLVFWIGGDTDDKYCLYKLLQSSSVIGAHNIFLFSIGCTKLQTCS